MCVLIVYTIIITYTSEISEMKSIYIYIYVYIYIYIYILHDVFGDDLARSGLDLVISWIFGLKRRLSLRAGTVAEVPAKSLLPISMSLSGSGEDTVFVEYHWTVCKISALGFLVKELEMVMF